VVIHDAVRRLVALVRPALRPSGSLPPPSRRGRWFDLGLALAMGLYAAASADDGSARPGSYQPGPAGLDPPAEPGLATLPTMPVLDRIGWFVLMVLVALPLAYRRRRPLAVLLATMAVAPLIAGDHATLRLSFYVCVIAGYSAVVYSRYRVPALVALPLAALLYSNLQAALPTVSDDSTAYLILLPLAVAADGIRRWQHRAQTLQREQAAALRRAAEVERARIARELHDVVTHNVSVMIIQAGAARKVMAATPDEARTALLAVEAGGRAAMAELRHVMGLLTMSGEDGELAPQPGLERLPALIEQVRSAGLPIDLSIVGRPRALPPGIDLAGYRVVQEALTNAVKYAIGSAATVVVEYGEDQLHVKVTDSGGTADPAASGNGRGLTGLRERLAVYGGTLIAGPRPGGGFRVAAHIPLGGTEVPATTLPATTVPATSGLLAARAASDGRS
jgi:signal transduction histidine kinase